MRIAKPNFIYRNPVFVVGMPRSGTTLIQGILCNTGQYFPIPETHFFVRATYDLPTENLSKKNLKQIQQKLLKKSRINLQHEFPEYLSNEKEVFEYVIDQFNKDGCRTFLEKTPRHIFFYSKIIAYYPDAKFICLIREPKNVISSHFVNSPIQNKSVIRLSLLYNKITSAILSIKDKKNVFLIRYEDLTTKKELVLKQTCNFLNIQWYSRLITNVAAPPEIVSSHEFWKKKNLSQTIIEKNNADQWQQTLTPRQANIINCITKSNAEKFGYKFSCRCIQLLNGVIQDMPNFFSPCEFRKAFSKYHG